MKTTLRSDIQFALQTSLLIVAAHAVAFFAHEYSHSVLAWALGFMRDPFGLDYGTATPGNILLQIDIDDNVQYAPILAGGHGISVTAIALAGPFVGNGLLYLLVYFGARNRLAAMPRALAAFLFWLSLMCAGNVWGYVPLRAITTHADIATAARGLGLSPLALFPFLAIPAFLIVGHFFARTCALFLPVIAPGATARTAMVVAVTSGWFFLFFGSVGVGGNYGAVTQALAVLSIAMLFPLSVVWLWHRCVDTPA
ncbi:hypothetical protein ACSBM8_13475 [Sphingomonas sp. ASY06-1R]|uniref:hypothetical protein n=1 Tax=Sphingomonas sp. ASY06-1R TaxID=3445771 RepID=UPI003FA1B5D8